MTDYFELLGEARRPWLDRGALKQKYHGLARQNQPGHEMNQAYRTLLDPKSRLQHLLSLEGVALSNASEQVPDDLIELFMQLAPVLKKDRRVEPAKIEELTAQAATLAERTLEHLREIDANWPANRGAALPLLEMLYRRLSYLARWQELLGERQFELSTM